MKKSVMENFAYSILLLVIYCATANCCHGSLLVSGITEEEKAIILQEHNRLRQLVATGRLPGQPGAENMREIHWDAELAAKAQKWAENCQFRHDPHRSINRFTMGQNLAIIWSTVPLDPDDGDFPSRIKNWFNEVQKYSFGDAWSPKTGHYSQLVWGETSLVGCGYAEYKDSSKYNKLYVCNYGPGGNVVGYNPYEVGKPSCGTYGMRPSARYQGLCSAPSVNSITSNTIETYEYKHTNNINTNTQNTNTHTDINNFDRTSYNPSSSSSQQALSPSTGYSSSIGSSYAYSAVSRTNTRIFSASTKSKETGNYNQHYSKSKNKLEAYKPSKAQFQTAVRKHTILRTYINTNSNSQTQPLLTEVSVTAAPVKRGWSLLSWSG